MSTPSVLNVKDFGAIGDGCHDDTDVHLEHLNIRKNDGYPRVLSFFGDLVRLNGLTVDGVIDSRKLDGTETHSRIIQAGPGTEVVVSGVWIAPHDPDVADPGDGGFTPLNGDALLFDGEDATYTLLDRPDMPVYPYESGVPGGKERKEWAGEDEHGTYDALRTYSDSFGGAMTPRVRVPEAKAMQAVALPALPAGAVHSFAITVPGAKPGDVVRLGPPPDLPAGLLATGVATAAGTVEVRLFNANPSAVPAQAATHPWTVLSGGGPQAGAPQVIPSSAPS